MRKPSTQPAALLVALAGAALQCGETQEQEEVSPAQNALDATYDTLAAIKERIREVMDKGIRSAIIGDMANDIIFEREQQDSYETAFCTDLRDVPPEQKIARCTYDSVRGIREYGDLEITAYLPPPSLRLRGEISLTKLNANGWFGPDGIRRYFADEALGKCEMGIDDSVVPTFHPDSDLPVTSFAACEALSIKAVDEIRALVNEGLKRAIDHCVREVFSGKYDPFGSPILKYEEAPCPE